MLFKDNSQIDSRLCREDHIIDEYMNSYKIYFLLIL